MTSARNPSIFTVGVAGGALIGACDAMRGTLDEQENCCFQLFLLFTFVAVRKIELSAIQKKGCGGPVYYPDKFV